MSDADTIHALASAPGRAGVAVVRVSGPQAGALCTAIAGELPPPRQASLRTLTDPETSTIIDRGLVLWFPGPASFTGEDVVEFHVHGGRAVLAALTGALSGHEGVRLAEAGEFSRRGFVNGRLDLTQAEGIADLVAAETEAQRKTALAQADGALSRLHAGWRDRLIRHLAHLEAWLDFPDEDLPEDVMRALRQEIGELTGDVQAHLADARRGERLRDGVTIAIVGPPNAGKSTLLNALAHREAAIVAETPGTTRDTVEVHLDFGGTPVVLIDTAGLRASDDPVEQEGIRRARTRAEGADLVLSVLPASVWQNGGSFAEFGPEISDSLRIGSPTVLRLVSQTDRADMGLLSSESDAYHHAVSAVTGDGMASLVEDLSVRARGLVVDQGRPLPTRERHRAGLQETLRHLGSASAWDSALPPEILAEDLRMALRSLGRISGAVDVEDLLDVIFRDFCIGK